MKRALLFIVITITLSCSVKKKSPIPIEQLEIRNYIKDSLQLFLKDSVFVTSRTDFFGNSLQRSSNSNDWIIGNASNEELKKMTESNNAYAKAIGIEGLFKRKDKDWFKNLKSLLRDTAEYVICREGCLQNDYRLPEYCLLEIVRYEYMDGILSQEQVKEVNKLISDYKLDVILK
jgi:hypothetical protein